MMRIRLAYLLLAASLPIVIFAAVMIVLFDRQQTRSWDAVVQQATDAALNTVDERITTVRIALETLIITGQPLAEWREELVQREIQGGMRLRREAAIDSTARLFELLSLKPRVPPRASSFPRSPWPG